MVLKGVESIFGLGGSEDDHGGIGKPVEQFEAVGAGHFYVEEEKVHPFLIEEFEGVHHVKKMPFDFDEVAFFAELAEEVRCDLDIFYYNARKFHSIIQINDPKLAGGQFALYDRREESADIMIRRQKIIFPENFLSTFNPYLR
jgi:hypothetical protein